MPENISYLDLDEIDMYYRHTLNLPNDVTFGLEIEFDNLLREKARSYIESNFENWKVVKEETVGDINIGGEVNSPILKDEIKYWKEIKKVLEYLKDNDASISNNCAGHIHIGSNIIGNNPIDYYYMLKLWATFENVIFDFSKGDYSHLRTMARYYAMPIKDKIISTKTYTEKFIKKFGESDIELSDIIDITNNTKKKAIYIGNVGNPIIDTIEIRIPNGSLNEITWQNNINFFTKFLLYFNGDYDKELIDYYFNNYKYNKNIFKKYLILGNIIFEDDLDYIYFLKQSSKAYSRKK